MTSQKILIIFSSDGDTYQWPCKRAGQKDAIKPLETWK